MATKKRKAVKTADEAASALALLNRIAKARAEALDIGDEMAARGFEEMSSGTFGTVAEILDDAAREIASTYNEAIRMAS